MTTSVRRPSRWRPPIAHVAIPVAFTLSIWSAATVHPVWLIRPLVLVVVVGLAIGWLVSRVSGDRDRGFLAAFAIGVAAVLDDLRAVPLLLLLAGLVVVDGVVRRETPLRGIGPVNRALTALALALSVVAAFNLVTSGAFATAVDDVRRDLAHVPPADPQPGRPDIWVVLLDGYPGEDAMARLAPAWDRDAFPAALRERGFDVQAHSRTNYLLTRLVLPAMFNSRHLVDLIPTTAGLNLAEKTKLLRDLTEEGTVLRLLGEAGYERIAFSPGWAEVGPRRVDRLIEPLQLTEFELALLRVSGAGAIVGAVAPNFHSDQVRDQIDDTLAAAHRLAAEDHDRPRFVFLHFPAPHPPMVYDGAGQPLNGSPGSLVDQTREPAMDRSTQIDLQTAYAEYTGSVITELVDEIRAEAGTPPVIVLFSDHGSATGFDGNDVLNTDLDERTSNLLAVLAPGEPDLLPDGATLVNVFPYVLNEVLAAGLEVQPDTFWAWRTGANIFDFVELDPATWRPR